MIQSTSLADQVFEHLENAIYSGTYAEGQILTETFLSKELGVSRTPVREALRRLEQERLIEETGKGSRVLGITVEDVEDIYEIRLRTEGLATRWAAQRMTDEQIRHLHELLDLQEFYLSQENTNELKNTDTQFHGALYEACGSKTLYEILSSLHRKMQRFRSRSLSHFERAAIALQEHRAILAALETKDPQKAEEAAVLHVRNARDNVLKTCNGDHAEQQAGHES